ncbi:hypothetical protein PPERSA_05613 [Pseudocohnilembus persalinus]|uniref:Calpain catalytic domain-containing protein n=1 Tax=Pseudocohnilembus persalinus TaxID=266149 RepID=A0A0V0QG60_PSEPJ|nr:hypothetical protein PPERSA_05613 [Pseudocohnilembus persalinus]|eukprot:KRX01213.1 hypothetical protein PPERSA_05613 [Pseudocohnilembus persalinus]
MKHKIMREESGFPPEELDAYKQKIDECGIFGDQFEDQNFPSIEQSINQNMQVEQQRELPPIDFHRISELQQFKKKLEQQNKNLFEKPIEPGQIVYNKCSDQQLLACIESLSRFPQLLQKVFTIKYELENVCFITLRLYSKGQWLEQVIDDFVPCYKVSRECVFANTQYNDLGWIGLQKVFSKYFGSYLYFYEPNFPKMASQYLQMMTGLPCKTITWNSLDISEDSHNQAPKKLKAKIFDKINSQKNQSKVGIAYLNKEYANMYGFSENTAYSIIDKLKLEDDSDNQGKESMYILLHNNVPEFKIESKSYNKNKLWERPEMKAFYKKNNMTKLGDKFMMLEIDEFLRQFNEINLLIGQPMMVQNNQLIEAEIKDYVHTDNRFYFKFQLSLPQRILINVQQHSKNNDEYLPVRMVLAKEIGTYLNNKAEFIKQKFVTDMVKQNQEGNLKKKKDKNRSSIQKSSRNIESQSQIQNQSQLAESKKQDNEQLKKKQLKYQYVFGKGQLKKENMYKYINLEAGSYVILIQAEGPDTKSESQKNQTMQKINFTMSLFTESLLKISKFQENENFLRNLYEQCIISAEQKVLESEGVQIEHFTRSDLQEREQGCNDLINTQYFLYKEGTYLQYLQNQSSEQSSKSWRQKLYFRTENMKILDQPDPHKVDLYLLPGTESLIIIQQIGAKPFKLEGGEGICIIEKIGKNKNQDLYKLGTSDNITKNDNMHEKYMASGNLAELDQEQQDDIYHKLNKSFQLKKMIQNDGLQRTATQITDSKKSYKGQILNGKKDGKGIEIDQIQKTQYVGYWQQNKYHGEGTLYYQNTNCYFKGYWEYNEKKNGQEIFPNGDQYEGEYKNNKFHGFGILHNKYLGYRYEGNFQNGKRDGYGKEFHRDLSVYEGNFKNNQKNGKGKHIYRNNSYYEGDFCNGIPQGYGLHVAYDKKSSKTLINNYCRKEIINKENSLDPQQNIQKPEEIDINNNENQKQLIQNINEDDQAEYYYEGEYQQGYRFGIGRYCEADGSYYYCNWEFDKKIGEILYYSAVKHEWLIFKYQKKENEDIKNNVDIQDKNPFEIIDQIMIVKEQQQGFPSLQFDAYKPKIEECGISGELFEDPYLLPVEESIQIPQEDLKQLSIPAIEFIRITEYQNSKYQNTIPQLFTYPIKPMTLSVTDQCDYQLLSCLESLCYTPNLLQKIFSPKYELDMIRFMTIKLFFDGQWREIVIDDFMPCLKIHKNSVFGNVSPFFEYGWFAVQKAFCKYKKSFFYYSKLKYPKCAEEYLELLTGLPTKTINWENIEDSHKLKIIEDKIWKYISSEKKNTKVRIAYLKEAAAKAYEVPKNYAYNIIDFVQLQEEIQGYSKSLEFNFLLLYTIDPDNKIRNENEMILMKNQKIIQMIERNLENNQQFIDDNEQNLEYQQEAQNIQNQRQLNKHQNFFVLGFRDFFQRFSQMTVILGQIKFQKSKFKGKNNTDNIELLQDQQDYYPTRIVLAQKRETKKPFKIEIQKTHANIDIDKYKQMVQLYEEKNNTKNPHQENLSDDLDDAEKLEGEMEQFQQKINPDKALQKQNTYMSEESQKSSEKFKDIFNSQSEYFKKDSVLENQLQQQSEQIQPRKGQPKLQSIFRKKIDKKEKKQQKKVEFQDQLIQLKETQKKSNKLLLAKTIAKLLPIEDQSLIENQIKQERQKMKEINKKIQETQLIYEQSQKKREMPYNYIYAKGQRQTKNMTQNLFLDRGSYIFMIQCEGPPIDKKKDDSKKNKGKKSFMLDFSFSIFSDQLIKINILPDVENFEKYIYEQCILEAEKIYSLQQSNQMNGKLQKFSKKYEYFIKNDLTDREDGSNDLIINQLFIKKEGTFLQYFKNKSKDKEAKIWRQKLYFKNENMIIYFQNQIVENQKIDISLWPQQEALVIIQQINGKPYKFEGGEGICIIDKIKNDSENEDEELEKIEHKQQQQLIENTDTQKQEASIQLNQKKQPENKESSSAGIKSLLKNKIKLKKKNQDQNQNQSDTLQQKTINLNQVHISNSNSQEQSLSSILKNKKR